jgi:hypothetical protein
MLAPLATLAFLATLWLVVMAIAQILAESGGKIAAALRGCSLLAAEPAIPAVALRVSLRSRPRALRAQPRLRPELRAAA